jgi:hypothetical protein
MAKKKNDYALELTKILSKLDGNLDVFVQKVIIDMGSSVIKRSPVRSGRFRNNWNFSEAAPDISAGRGPDPAGSGAQAQIAALAAKAKAGGVFYFTNALPYAWRIETGWSDQAPSGVVGLTVAEFQAKVDKAAGEIKS